IATRFAAFLKNAWAKEQVLVASFCIRGLAIILPAHSPYTTYALRINPATPYNYPVHPQGPSLERQKCKYTHSLKPLY
uniref:NADH dehydrogenase [ubiquinone] 1 alpha subcomplex subunit 3 n=1 Tax=Catagonus wagneri TaxID=51154 RepID=A0A8C3WZD5_9CETA